MPKEVVRAAPDVEMSVRGSEEVVHPVCEVRWSREGSHVQVVTRALEREFGFDPSSPETEIPVGYGYFVDLDRQGINALIRNLRRARDQAFGRDE